ncbi:MAG TPA: protein phosphatase 2C domain-containing protein [Actinotalea sp.]|nr:protein phosphatase 2C domain-containing protein [Actinotalea sp.]
MRTAWGSATDRGERQYNEDSLLAYPPVFLVADGMGGHCAGDVASRIAVEEFSQLAGRTSVVPDDVHGAVHRTAGRLRDAVPDGRTAGTTVAGVALVAHEGGAHWLVFNIGDSRVYRYADDRLQQISVDHSVVQELLDHGVIGPAEVAGHPERHIITRAIGTHAEPEPDYWLLPVGPGDRMLVCTDGLTVVLGDDVLAQVLRMPGHPQDAAGTLVARAVAGGATDNITAVVVDVAALGPGTDLEATGSRRRMVLAEAHPAAEAREGLRESLVGTTGPRHSRGPAPEVDR